VDHLGRLQELGLLTEGVQRPGPDRLPCATRSPSQTPA
jgi:hypothetical protein